jgi:hypothetical protein
MALENYRWKIYISSLSCVKALAAHASNGNYKSWSILNLVDEALHATSSTSLDEGADL